MIVDLLLVLLGLGLLLSGGEMLVRGASRLARAFGVSPLVIGMTVVALGTSAPELAVNLAAAFRGNGELSFGNIIGSCNANIGLILGCSALLSPLAVNSIVIARELPMLLLACAVTMVFGLDAYLGDGPGRYGRDEGLVLLFLLGLFLFYTWGDISKQVASGANKAEQEGTTVGNVLLVLAGLTMLCAGGEVTVRYASSLAGRVGVSDAVIGLTIVAVGTSLPELVVALIAGMRREADLAIGNVVGSNIMNLVLIFGSTSVVRPIDVPARGLYDLAFMGFLTVALWPLARGNVLGRAGGSTLLILYIAYTLWRARGG